jgi:hypothetical protein
VSLRVPYWRTALISAELLSNCLFTLEIGIAIRLGSIAVFGREKELPECDCKFRVVV